MKPTSLEPAPALGDIPPECAVHVGDRIVDDIQGAQSAGMKAILKSHPRRVPVEGIEPDARIGRLAELPALPELRQYQRPVQFRTLDVPLRHHQSREKNELYNAFSCRT